MLKSNSASTLNPSLRWSDVFNPAINNRGYASQQGYTARYRICKNAPNGQYRQTAYMTKDRMNKINYSFQAR
ncbi:hypothetical protein GCM10027185_44130 [Spirosoma pulveris]